MTLNEKFEDMAAGQTYDDLDITRVDLREAATPTTQLYRWLRECCHS